MKHISIIGTVGVPACYGGFESLVDNLLDYTPEDVRYTVFCSSRKYPSKLTYYKGAKLIYLDMEPNGLGSVFYDFKSMRMSLDADIMLILGVSGCVFLPYIRRHFKGKIVTNIDGLEWKREKWKWYAKLFLQYSERKSIEYSHVVVGDNKGITSYVKDIYQKDAILIAYGGDHAVRTVDDSLYEQYPFCRQTYAITVCRIEPENMIHCILSAFSEFNKMHLVIIGNWYQSDYGRTLKDIYSKYDNIYLLDPIYDLHIINWFRGNSFVYIHGHSAGGTNPSLVEAMNLGLPILAYDCVYNRATTDNKCLYWKSVVDLKDMLSEKISRFSEIANNMKNIGRLQYTWKKIAEKYNNVFCDY
jgi:glycosyltransferase involved in cell wall biosynthesis